MVVSIVLDENLSLFLIFSSPDKFKNLKMTWVSNFENILKKLKIYDIDAKRNYVQPLKAWIKPSIKKDEILWAG